MSARRAAAIIDATGALLILLTIAVAEVAASAHGGDAGPLVALVLAVAGMVVVGRLAGRMHRVLVPAAVAIVAVALALTSGVLDRGPLGGPFEYRNATGAFYVQAVVAALMVAAAVRWWPLRAVGIAVAVWFAAIAATVSVAAAACLIVVAVASIALGGARMARASIVAVALISVVVLAGTVALGVGHRPGADPVFARALTERRLELWHESLALIADHPGGVGPGRFQDVDPTALQDRDARWAHNEFLQQGVELGWAGLVLVVLLFLWGFARLWVHPAPDLVVALGAASLAALGIHASVDYVLHFPALPLAAAALVGTAQTVRSRRSRRDDDDAGQEGLEGDAHPSRVADAPAAG